MEELSNFPLLFKQIGEYLNDPHREPDPGLEAAQRAWRIICETIYALDKAGTCGKYPVMR